MREEKNSKGKKNAFLVLLLVLLLGITVGFATLNASLNISGNSKIKSSTWDVGPDDQTPIECPTGEVCTINPQDPSNVDPDDGSEQCTDPNDQSTCTPGNGAVIWTEDDGIHFKHVLLEPGDTFTFNTSYTNSGTIDAKIASNGVTLNVLNYDGDADAKETAAKFLTYTVKYADNGQTPAANDILAAGETREFTVTVTYKADIAAVPTAAELALINGGQDGEGATSLFSVTYVQA